ncbi:hypothetical protein BDY17DRAFT_307894 [Neohortaea acidophila]|uniref:Cytochrome P450 n=1 Tax=Neohortaea acidophila TaxID=245834 RepID=A0A6A6Q329_9PEZI|nr:uncharacterized protein BDY17DRAFT_307894 [Neohortaea acidophila]KAF2486409.1 hypothetical protein BDY17DRAFT_307894 [Neohortaea acidophila]
MSPLLTLLPVLVLTLFLLEPFATYFRDVKNLRRFPDAFPLSGVSNIPFAHLKHSVICLGPNVVSSSSPAAIRTNYDHSTPCVKDGSYPSALSPGDHPGLIDVVDKDAHASKQRILSNAFVARNSERWEFKVDDKVQQLLRQFDKTL